MGETIAIKVLKNREVELAKPVIVDIDLDAFVRDQEREEGEQREMVKEEREQREMVKAARGKFINGILVLSCTE